MTSVSHWQIDDIDDALAADFDGSLSGLGMELGTASFNMRYARGPSPPFLALRLMAPSIDTRNLYCSRVFVESRHAHIRM